MNDPRTNAERIKLLRKIFSNPGEITSFFRIERILNARKKAISVIAFNTFPSIIAIR